MIDRYQLRYVLAVVDHGNFSNAAAACAVSQPTLSIGIAKLEKAIGAVLFHRTNRRVELTEAGVAFAAHARMIEEGFARAERAVAGAGAPAVLRLGLLATTPAAFMEEVARRHRASGDPQRIEIVEGRPRELGEGLARGRIDIAFSLLRGDARLHQEPLFTEGYSLALSARHPLAGRASVAAEELVSEPMIVRRRCELLAETSRHFTQRGVRPFFAARTTCDERALRYVRAGLGMTIMPDCFALDGVARAQVEEFAFTRELGLIYAPHVDAEPLRRTPAVRALVEAAGAMASHMLA